MDQGKDFYLITDIGSTTTKAILIKNTGSPTIVGICHANTTVEAPFNDVRFGIMDAIQMMEKSSGLKLLKPGLLAPEFEINDNVGYLATSSAGGGLQILVIGLTLFDSASSARRAAYGAGGIILDVFAMDDKRTAAEQMMSMRNLHPDMILLSGGTDGGAVSGVLRLAEILRIAKPLPKFVTNQKIPTLYAGNKDVQHVIKHMISKDFDLVVLPNLRPTMEQENLKPTRDMIQTLFMENVMERAPGYAMVKRQVSADILPTPMGVLGSLIPITDSQSMNFFAFDIGGATTDVFSYIKGNYQRTVSANLGMSYSALNVMAESEIEAITELLPPDVAEEDIRSYIGNKTLYPTYNPQSVLEFRIEHALAKQAIRLALNQHQEMHYNSEELGFLDKIKTESIDAYEAKFKYEMLEQHFFFYPSEIDVLIGAGGVFAHALNPKQSLSILIDAFDAHGITEIWLDKDFVTPHLGVLGQTDPKLAKTLLEKECIQKVAVHIRPHFPTKHKKPVLKVDIMEAGLPRTLELLPGSFMVLPGTKMRELRLTPLGKSVLGLDDKPKTLKTELMVILDTRISMKTYCADVERALDLYPALETGALQNISFKGHIEPFRGTFSRVVNLPYPGKTYFTVGDRVSPDDVVAANPLNPPRLYVVQPYTGLDDVNEALVRSTIQTAVGEKVDFGTNLRHLPTRPKKGYVGQDYSSPVRGKVEHIDFYSGTMILSEIQDYKADPVHINIAESIGCPPRKAGSYLKHQVGDFVYQGDLLAMRLVSNTGKMPSLVIAPSTGKITDYDSHTSVLTIQYQQKPFNYYAHVNGTISEVVDDSSVTISYAGTKLEGKLGLGERKHGIFIWADNADKLDTLDLSGRILGLNQAPSLQMLNMLADRKIRALVVPGIDQATLVEFMGKELGIVNTGNEDLPCAILIIDAFGAQSFDFAVENLLARMDQALCYVDTHTRIRAGVARPNICFCTPT